MARIYGIDLGHRTVRLAVYEGAFGRMTLEGYREVPVAQDLEQQADLTTRLAALDALLAPLELHGSDGWGIGFPTEQASVRRIQLPFSDREKVEQALPFEVENQVPFELDDMVLSSRILHSDIEGSDVLCGMAPTGVVGSLLQALSERSVDPKALVVDADLLGHFATSGVQVVVDFGHSRTLVALCQDGRVHNVRAISMGGRDLTVAVARSLSLDFEQAEAKKHEVGLGGAEAASVEAEWLDAEPTQPSAQLSEWDEDTTAAEVLDPASLTTDSADSVLKGAILPLITQLRATLIAFEDAHEVDIDEVLIAGGGARLRGLKSLLTDVLGVPVRPVVLGEPDVTETADPVYALAYAAANRIGTGKGRLLDLRVDAFAYRGNLAAIGNVLRYSALGAAALLLAGMGFFFWRTAQLNNQMAELDTEMVDTVVRAFPDVSADKVDSGDKAKAIMAEKLAESSAMREAVEAIISDEPPMLATWLAISQHVPAHEEAPIDVRELQVSETTISMKAETNGFEDAAKIEASLQKHPPFKSATKGDEKKVKEKVRFTVTIPLGTDEEEEG